MEIFHQVSHYLGETVIRIDSYPAGELFLTLTQQTYVKGNCRSPLVQLRNQLRRFDQHRTLRDTTLRGRLGLVTCPWTHANGSPHILASSRVCTLHFLTPGLSRATQFYG
jgi:hypothetical protein